MMKREKLPPNTNRHVWKKTNLFATSQFLKELADRDVTSVSPMKGTYVLHQAADEDEQQN